MTVFGDYDASYYLLPKWMNVLQATNLGTKVVWKITPLGNFKGNVRFKIFVSGIWSYYRRIQAL